MIAVVEGVPAPLGKVRPECHFSGAGDTEAGDRCGARASGAAACSGALQRQRRQTWLIAMAVLRQHRARQERAAEERAPGARRRSREVCAYTAACPCRHRNMQSWVIPATAFCMCRSIKCCTCCVSRCAAYLLAQDASEFLRRASIIALEVKQQLPQLLDAH